MFISNKAACLFLKGLQGNFKTFNSFTGETKREFMNERLIEKSVLYLRKKK